jgi:hypothetical protein
MEWFFFVERIFLRLVCLNSKLNRASGKHWQIAVLVCSSKASFLVNRDARHSALCVRG